MLKQSPLLYRMQQKQAEFGSQYGWEIALSVPGETNWRGKDGVGLCDLSSLGVITVEGPGLPKAFPSPGSVKQTKKGHYFRLRPDRGIILVAQGELDSTLNSLKKVKSTVTDQTDGHSVLAVLGGSAPDLLRRVCGLDFHDSSFPNKHVKATSVAKTRQLILRWDKSKCPNYFLIGQRSLADYLFTTLEEAGLDLNCTTLGSNFFTQI